MTDAGENLLRRVRPAVSELGDAVGQVRRYRERPAGVVRIHAFRSAARTYVEPILAAFAEAYPDVVLNLTLDDEVVDVVAGGFDVAIRIGEVIEKDMVVARWARRCVRSRSLRPTISPSMAVRSTRAIWSGITAFNGAGLAA